MKTRLLVALLCIPVVNLFAEEKSPVKFGKIETADFEKKIYPIDSSANAVVIADIGTTEMIGNYNGGFSLEFKRFSRVHILNKNGYDAASFEIALYTSGVDKEQLTSLKAVTYNLENGKISETKLETKTGVFEDRINKNWVVKKFTMPGIKEGSIIEFQYTIQSDFIFNLQPWTFQGENPTLWSEYTVSIPEFYYYLTLTQGYQNYYIKDEKGTMKQFTVTTNGGAGGSERFSFSANVVDYRYVMKDVPPLKEESFTSTVKNHISKIEFQLSERRYPMQPKRIMGNWLDVTKQLMEDEDFGLTLNRDNGAADVVKQVTANASSDLQKAYSIYSWVRDNMTCTGYNSKYLDKPLKTTIKTRNGSEADINLLLTSMLRTAGLNADPVIISTRQHGYAMDMYPLLDRYNYVISQLTINDKQIFLDASESKLGFGKLKTSCYNGPGRVINESANSISLESDDIKETSVCILMMNTDEKGNLKGTMKQNAGYYQSFNLRNKLKEKGKDQVINDIKKDFGGEAEVSQLELDSLERFEQPVTIRYDVELKNENENILYINPMFGEAVKENPFKSATRLYPVEMPFAIDETYIFRMEVPEGYTVDELPKQIKLKLNEDGDGMFEYLLTNENDVISLRSRIILNRAIYLPDEYEILREFYKIIAQKHNEQIVLKKKS